MNGLTTERLLRAGAMGIALFALCDPPLSRSTTVPVTVVVLEASPADRALADTVTAAFDSSFVVSRVDVVDAAAYVVVGESVPPGWQPPDDVVVFAVDGDGPSRMLRIRWVDAPKEVAIDSAASVGVDLEVPGAGARVVEVALVVDGVRVQSVDRSLTGDETRVTVPLTFVPVRAGLVRLRVEAAVQGAASAVADVGVRVSTRVWKVLAFDGRPTYAATFVRRALEADPRFDVTTRSVTSRGASVQTGAAPTSLSNARALAAFDLVVVGAPAALGATDAAALETYLRDGGGAVVLLPEEPGGTVLRRLTGATVWSEDQRREPAAVTSGLGTFSATAFLWPERWPALVTSLASVEDGGTLRSAVWQIPVGAGRLIVSSATDGWRSRGAGEASRPGFSEFWRAVAAGAAQGTPAGVTLDLRETLLTPGDMARVRISGVASGIDVQVRHASGAVAAVHVWPTGREGIWEGEFRAPAELGRYTVSRAGGQNATREFLVVAPDERVRPDLAGDGLASLVASSHRGTSLPATSLSTLAARVSAAVPMVQATTSWRPLRAVWWVVPFTACAAGEWWLRRRRGQR
ncbi:MAG: hypothetical protein HQ485_16205 [Acidobacteria bacterium]|nr:hypothetical protein [Acidobacteriota bacterium]